MDYYSFTNPEGMEGLSWPCWLTHSGHLTHKVVTCQLWKVCHQPQSLGQDCFASWGLVSATAF